MKQNNFPAVLAHLDLAPELYYRHLMGEKNILKNYYLEEFRQAGVKIIVSSLYIEEKFLPEQSLKMALLYWDALQREIVTVQDQVVFVTSKEMLQKVMKENKIGILLSFEGAEPLEENILLLNAFYKLGVRGLGLTWSRANNFATGCCRGSENKDVKGEITSLGKELIWMAEDLGMWIDVSHLNDDGFTQLLDIAKKPFMASHSNARDICFNYRNLSDSHLKEFGKRGGVIGVNGYSKMIGKNVKSGEEGVIALCRHIGHIIEMAGPDCVGLGLDLCGRYYEAVRKMENSPEIYDGDILTDHREIINIPEVLLEIGLKKKHVRKVIGDNLVKYFTGILK